MKKNKLFKLTLISSIIFFTACSNKEAKVKNNSTVQRLSVYNIMGITEAKSQPIQFTITETIPKETFVPAISPDIEFISYKEETPIISEYQTVATYEPIPTTEAVPYTEQPIAPYKISAIYPTTPDNKTIDSIERNAKKFLGVPYVWGATGPSKFDCSGFTQWVYRDVGIKIPRVSRDQAKVGEYIRYADLQRGDMVFFDTKKHRKGKVTHVGIYLGNGDFIHASSSGKKVVIYNFNKKSFYKKRFLWGRRVTNNHFYYASN